MASFNEQIYALVRAIPAGRVLTYGRVSQLLGVARGARAVGWALAVCPDDVPWQRVINAQGYISNTSSPEAPLIQRDRLEAEGIAFGMDGQVDLTRYLWTPDPIEVRAIVDHLR